MKIILCANCKSFDVALYSRKKYLLRFGGSIISMLIGILIVYGLYGEDFAPPIIIGILWGLILFFLSVIFMIYYLISVVLTKETRYKCHHCKNKSNTEVIIRDIDPNSDFLMNMIKKRK
jgi:hypothetical protein